MWKSLVTSEQAVIRTANSHITYNGDKPTIICTNNIRLLALLRCHPYFETECWFYEIEEG